MNIQSLDGDWQLKQLGSSEIMKAHVPGCVHLDLVHNKKIEDPFFGDNEFRVSWVHESDWEYSRDFDVDADLLGSDKVCLECDGLDTIADVYINGKLLSRTDNMYIQYCFDVKDRLEVGKNKICIRFHSPVNYAKPLIEKNDIISPGVSIQGSI